MSWTCLIEYVNGEEIIWTLYKEKLQKTNQKQFRIEKCIRTKVINYMSKSLRKNCNYNYMSNEKVMIILSTVELIRKILLYKNELFCRIVH